MYKPNEPRPDRPNLRGSRLAAAAGIAALLGAAGMLVQLPLGAAAGLVPNNGVSHGAAASKQKAPGTYRLRCWQYGRLLFDEGPVSLGTEARQGARLVAIDRDGAPLIVTDAGGTTCLARPAAAAAPNLALPR